MSPVLVPERQSISLNSAEDSVRRGLAVSGYPALGARYGQITLKKVGNVVPANYFSSNLTFFCRNELMIEKATSIPFRFRLGSVSYTDYLERKPNAIAPR